jgi:hypothetical protein
VFQNLPAVTQLERGRGNDKRTQGVRVGVAGRKDCFRSFRDGAMVKAVKSP